MDLGNEFLDMIPKSTNNKIKHVWKYQTKKLLPKKKKKTKTYQQNKNITYKGFISKMYKEFIQFYSKPPK